MEKKILSLARSHLNSPVNPNAFQEMMRMSQQGGPPRRVAGQRRRQASADKDPGQNMVGRGVDWGRRKFTIKWNTGCFRQTLGTAKEKTTPYK